MAARQAAQARSYPVRYRAPAGFIVASAAFAAIFVALSLSAFHAPTPRDLPVGIEGPSAVTDQVEQILDSSVPRSPSAGWWDRPVSPPLPFTS